jgi:putative solute:sodium symporter small subunit
VGMDIEIQLLVASFFAGMLTILAPCILPVLPVIISGSAGSPKNNLRPIIIIWSLMSSIVIFTMLLRASTALIDVPTSFWTALSGSILIFFGLITIFPKVWDFISLKLNLSTRSNKLLAKSATRQGYVGDALIGASLGPVFASCSPTYAVIVGIAITGNATSAFIYLLLYALGLGIVMLAISFAGRALIQKLGWATNPHGWFKRIIGLLFVIMGLMIITGVDKSFTAWILEGGFYDWVIQIESRFLDNMNQA